MLSFKKKHHQILLEKSCSVVFAKNFNVMRFYKNSPLYEEVLRFYLFLDSHSVKDKDGDRTIDKMLTLCKVISETFQSMQKPHPIATPVYKDFWRPELLHDGLMDVDFLSNFQENILPFM